MKVLTESWVHPYLKIVQNLHLFLTGKESFYIAQTKRELFSRSWNERLGSFTLLSELGILVEIRRDISLTR